MIHLLLGLVSAEEPTPGLCLVEALVVDGAAQIEALQCEAARMPQAREAFASSGLELGEGSTVLQIRPYWEPDRAVKVRTELSRALVQGGELWPTFAGDVLVELSVADSPTSGASDSIDWKKLEPRKVGKPRMPSEAKEHGIEGDCKVRVYVDPAGSPQAMRFEGCPMVFRSSVHTAVFDSSWEPFEVRGEARPANFVFNYSFKLRP